MAEFSPRELEIIATTIKSTLLRAADIVERISDQDVDDARVRMLQETGSLDAAGRVTGQLLAASHLRAMARKSPE